MNEAVSVGEHFGFSWTCYGPVAYDEMDDNPVTVDSFKGRPKENEEVVMDREYKRDYSIRFVVQRKCFLFIIVTMLMYFMMILFC